jgi:hypothetical protein
MVWLIEAKLCIVIVMEMVRDAAAACRRHAAHRAQGAALRPRLAVSSNPVTAHCGHCTLAGLCSGSPAASATAAVGFLVKCTALVAIPVDLFFARLRLVMQRVLGTGSLVV